MGVEEIEGASLGKLYIPEHEITFYLDPETALPVMSQYEEMNPQTGADMQVTSHYFDWTESEGVRVAYRTVDKADGEEIAQSTVTSHTVE